MIFATVHLNVQLKIEAFADAVGALALGSSTPMLVS